MLQIPAVISSGSTIDEVNSKIKTATLAYLRESEKTHADDLNGKLKPTLVTPNSGIVAKTNTDKYQENYPTPLIKFNRSGNYYG